MDSLFTVGACNGRRRTAGHVSGRSTRRRTMYRTRGIRHTHRLAGACDAERAGVRGSGAAVVVMGGFHGSCGAGRHLQRMVRLRRIISPSPPRTASRLGAHLHVARSISRQPASITRWRDVRAGRHRPRSRFCPAHCRPRISPLTRRSGKGLTCPPSAPYHSRYPLRPRAHALSSIRRSQRRSNAPARRSHSTNALCDDAIPGAGSDSDGATPCGTWP